MLIPHSRNVSNSSFFIFPKFIITMQRYIFFLKRPLPKLRNYLPLLQNCVRLNPEIISSFLVRISFTSPLHILPPFHNPIPPIPDGIHQRSYTPKPLIDGTRQKSSGLQPLEPSAPRTDQPPARGGRLVCLSYRTIIFRTPWWNKDVPVCQIYLHADRL